MDYPLDEYEMLANDIEHCLANNNADKLSDGDPDRIRQLLRSYLAAEQQHDELLAALNAIYEAYYDGDGNYTDAQYEALEKAAAALSAIAKARGQQ